MVDENYGHWEPPYGDYPVNGSLYGQALIDVAAAMKNRYSHLHFGAVVYPDDNCASAVQSGLLGGTITDWTKDVMQSGAAQVADFMIIHNYFTSGTAAPNNTELFGEVGDQLETMYNQVNDMLTSYAPTVSMPPLILSEFNIAMLSTGGCGATLQFVNCLWHAKFLGRAIQGAEFASVVSFGWADVANDCKYTGRGSKGDYGMVSRSNTDFDDGTPTPQLYSYALWALVFGDTMVNSTLSGDLTGIEAFSSTFSGGEVGLVLVNTDSEPRMVTWAGLNSSTANGWMLSSTDDSDPLSAYGIPAWNGKTNMTSFPLTDHSSYLLSSDGSGFQFDVPAYAAIGVVAYN